MNRAGRIVAVTGGLAVGGLIFGGLAAILAFLATMLPATEWPLDGLLADLATVFTYGGMLGAVLFPVAGFLLMRTVPLWLALAGTLAGATAGGILGFFIPYTLHRSGAIVYALFGALLGFMLSTVLLRILAGRAARREATPISIA